MDCGILLGGELDSQWTESLLVLQDDHQRSKSIQEAARDLILVFVYYEVQNIFLWLSIAVDIVDCIAGLDILGYTAVVVHTALDIAVVDRIVDRIVVDHTAQDIAGRIVLDIVVVDRIVADHIVEQYIPLDYTVVDRIAQFGFGRTVVECIVEW